VPVAVQGSISDLPIYLAIDRGYFKAQGLNVEVQRFNTITDEVAPLATGQLMAGVGGVSSGLFNAASRGIALQIVADRSYTPPDFKGTGFAVRKDLLDSGKVKEPKDIKGLTFGMGSTGSVIDTELELLLSKGGLTRNDVTLKQLSYGDQVAAFANKSIDVAYTFEPFLSAMQSKGLADLWMPSGQLVPNHEQSVIVYGPEFVKNPAAANGWMVAYIKGIRDYVAAYANGTPPDDVVATMAKFTNQDPNIVRTLKPSPVNPDGARNPTSLKLDLDEFVKLGLVNNPPPLDKVMNSSHVDAAVKQLGKYQAK